MRQPNGKGQKPAFPGQTRAPVETKNVQFEQTVWATGLDHPWGLAFLPDGRALVTERPGRIRYIEKDGKISEPLTGLPAISAQGGQAGLFDVVLDPGFARNKRVYISYMAPVDGGVTLTVMRAELNGNALTNSKNIFAALPVLPPSNNMGGRMLIAADGNLFLTVGDRFPRPYTNNTSQNLDSHLGKIVRITTDGAAPKDNPFVGQANAKPEIWAIGTRSQEALAIRPGTTELWEVEHGARGGDEINLIEKGKNYGWPVIAYGIDYSGQPILEGITQKAGMEQPLYYWDPVIAPSSILFYTGDKFPAWKNSLFITGLASQSLVRVSLDGKKVVGEERLLGQTLRKRVRGVKQGPDGLLYILTDVTDGQILKLSPK
jgi:glucose/arabinose dehydrogenase